MSSSTRRCATGRWPRCRLSAGWCSASARRRRPATRTTSTSSSTAPSPSTCDASSPGGSRPVRPGFLFWGHRILFQFFFTLRIDGFFFPRRWRRFGRGAGTVPTLRPRRAAQLDVPVASGPALRCLLVHAPSRPVDARLYLTGFFVVSSFFFTEFSDPSRLRHYVSGFLRRYHRVLPRSSGFL